MGRIGIVKLFFFCCIYRKIKETSENVKLKALMVPFLFGNNLVVKLR